MEELETREETVRVIREGDADADHESVTIEKTKTIRKTVDRPKKPSGKRTDVNKIANALAKGSSQTSSLPSIRELEGSQSQDMLGDEDEGGEKEGEQEEEEEEEEEAQQQEKQKGRGQEGRKGKEKEIEIRSVTKKAGAEEAEEEEEEGGGEEEEEEPTQRETEEEEEEGGQDELMGDQGGDGDETEEEEKEEEEEEEEPQPSTKKRARESQESQEEGPMTRSKRAKLVEEPKQKKAGGQKRKTTATKTTSKKTTTTTTNNNKRKKRRGEEESLTGLGRLNTYVYRVLRQVHPGLGLSKRGMEVMSNFLSDIYGRLTSEASHLVKIEKRATLNAIDIQSAVRLVLPGTLRKHAVAEGTQALTRITTANSRKRK